MDWREESKMKLDLTADQLAELQPILTAIDGGKVCVGQIRRSPYPDADAGAFTLIYTLVSQETGKKIRDAIEKERTRKEKRQYAHTGTQGPPVGSAPPCGAAPRIAPSHAARIADSNTP